jgi:hypothetical protein
VQKVFGRNVSRPWQRPFSRQGKWGGEYAVVATAVPARGWDEGSQSLEELRGREVQRGAFVRQGSRGCVEQAGYFAVAPAQAVQGERRSGRVAQEAFQAGAVPRFDANRSVDRDTLRGGARGASARRCRARATAACEALEHTPTHRGFGGRHIVVAQAERFVELHRSFGVWRKGPVDHQHVKVKMWIQTGAKAVDERHGA